MKTDNQNIIRTARSLRDEQNAQLHVSPWNRRKRFHIPGWLVAVPAAALIGFVFGLWTNDSVQKDASLTALVDTVYIKMNDSLQTVDTNMVAATNDDDSAVHEKKRRKTPTNRLTTTKATLKRSYENTGQPVSDDKIRYDLLVMN